MAATATSTQLRKRAGWPFVALVLAAPILGAVAGFFTDFGRTAKPDYYVTAAQVYAVLLIPLLGFATVALSHMGGAGRRKYATRMTQGVLLQIFIMLGASLWALAAEESSTFLCLTVALTLANEIVAAVFFSVVTAMPELLDPPETVAETA